MTARFGSRPKLEEVCFWKQLVSGFNLFGCGVLKFQIFLRLVSKPATNEAGPLLIIADPNP
jgi:hypothetical protein